MRKCGSKRIRFLNLEKTSERSCSHLESCYFGNLWETKNTNVPFIYNTKFNLITFESYILLLIKHYSMKIDS